MSGHSKWATIKRSKAANDAKRGAIFTKLGNLITISAREKGGDIDTNFTLRMAIEKAKIANMPKENIERAIKKGIGELDGGQIEELIYEGIGPANSQFIIKSLTDSKNRSASSIRHLFSKFGGSFATVMWNFDQKGVIRISNEELSKADLVNNEVFELELIDAGAEDIQKEEEGITVMTSIEDLHKVKKLFEEKKVMSESAEIEYVAKDTVMLEDEDLQKVENFIEEIEDCEDVGAYYSNINNV